MIHSIEVITNPKDEAMVGILCSSLQTIITISYQKLVALFGVPGCLDEDKTDAEWVLRFCGEILTIYNYKDGKNYCGRDGTPTEDITEWHIGGSNQKLAESFARKIMRFEVAILKPFIKKI